MLNEELKELETMINEGHRVINYQNTLEDLLYGVETMIEYCHDCTLKNSEGYDLGKNLEYLLHRVLLTTKTNNGKNIDLGLDPKEYHYEENKNIDLNLDEE